MKSSLINILIITIICRGMVFASGQKVRDPPLFPYKPDAGYLNVLPESNTDKEDNQMFYWHIQAENNPETAPLLIWMAGGPGCAGSFSLFYHTGPFFVKNFKYDRKTGKYSGDKEAVISPTSWNKNYNLLLPDNPIGTGFSTVKDKKYFPIDKEQATEQFKVFFLNFLGKHPEYKKRPLIFTGGSFGGHWAPYFASGLQSLNNPDINIQGLVLMSGFYSAKESYETYPSFSMKNKEYTKLTPEIQKEAQKLTDLCAHLAGTYPEVPIFAQSTFGICENSAKMCHSNVKNFDIYDMKHDHPGNWSFSDFLNYPEVQQYLGVKKNYFNACESWVDEAFRPGDYWVDSRPIVEEFLAQGLKVLMVSGANDWLLNLQYAEQQISSLRWSGSKLWKETEKKPFEGGTKKEVFNLRYYLVDDASHVPPNSQPEVCFRIMNDYFDWLKD